MFGDVYGYDYAMLRHAELVKAAEDERLAHRIEEAARADDQAREPRPRYLVGRSPVDCDEQPADACPAPDTPDPRAAPPRHSPR